MAPAFASAFWLAVGWACSGALVCAPAFVPEFVLPFGCSAAAALAC